MIAKKNPKTIKSARSEKKVVKNVEKKTERKEKSVLQKAAILQKNIKTKKDDKMLEKVEKYVDKNREKTSQEILVRKSKRPAKKYQEWELEVMISRVGVQSKSNEKTKEVSKRILYAIYAMIFIAILIFMIKYFFALNVPQIS